MEQAKINQALKYAAERNSTEYIREVEKIIDRICNKRLLQKIIDVGCHQTNVIQFGHFVERIGIDKDLRGYKKDANKNENRIEVDWFDYEPDSTADVITCLQTIEHLADVYEAKRFCKKLRLCSNITIASIPYKWNDYGKHGHHLNHIGLMDLISYFEEEPFYVTVITDTIKEKTSKRLIAVFGNQLNIKL
jgi:hypothetical protein